MRSPGAYFGSKLRSTEGLKVDCIFSYGFTVTPMFPVTTAGTSRKLSYYSGTTWHVTVF